MAIALEDGKKLLIDTIVKNKTHKHYKRVTKLAKLYRQLITGEEIDELLRRFSRREDEQLFEQRKNLTQSITPSVSSALMNPFQKVGRNNAIIKHITFKSGSSDEKKLDDIKEAILKYNGDKSVDRYLETRFVDLNFTDPNAYIITEFDNVPLDAKGAMTGKVQPRPFECSSTQAINMAYKNNILQWLIVRLDITYTLGDKEEAGYSYTIYLDNDAIKFTQVDPGTSIIKNMEDNSSLQGEESNYFRVSEKEAYVVEVFNHKAGMVPAVRVGYKLDLVTDGETVVNPMHDAMPYFMKSIKTVSEFDLTMALHAFPQKFQYVNRCSGDSAKKISCDSGYSPEGHACTICGGSGWAIQKSAQDAIVMRMPKNKDEMVDMSQLVHYEYPPIELLKFQNEYIQNLKNECRQAVFNSEIFSKTEVSATATERRISMDSVYDTLFPFAERFSSVYKYIVELIAKFRDIEGIVIEHRFPKDFKFKTVSELLDELQKANTSNAPGYVRQEISTDIAEHQFVDKPEQLKKIRAKQKFFPFPDKTPQEIMYIISNNKTSQYSDVLWANFEPIFLSLESDAIKSGLSFYDYPYEKQKALLDAKVKEEIEKIEAEAPAQSSGFATTQQTNDEGGENTGGGRSEGLGKLPLALQQLALARTRDEESGDKDLSKRMGDKMDELINQI